MRVVGAMLVVFAAGCGGSGEECAAPAGDRDAALRALHERIEQLGGEGPVVSLELFFTANEDPASFMPNLDPHPGLDRAYCVLSDIRGRANVSDVVIHVDEVYGGDEWPFAPAASVITTASAREVHAWAKELRPDPPGPEYERSWFEVPPGAPEVPKGYGVVTLYWD